MPEFSHLDAGTDPAAWAAWRAALPRVTPWQGTRRLVVVAAHPDDETLGAGGLMAMAAARDVDVELVSVTWGEASHPGSPTHTPAQLAARREDELAQALAALAPAALHHRLDLPDGEIATHQDDLEATLRRVVGPDGEGVVLACPLLGDGHPDHDAVARATLAVGREVGATVLELPIWQWQWSDPAQTEAAGYVAVALDAPARQAKAAALAAHRSQHEALSAADGDEPILSPRFLGHFRAADEVFRRTEPAAREHPMDRVHASDDPWGVDEHFYEARKRAVTLASLPRQRFGRALEVGCSVGALAVELAGRCEDLLAVDLSESAVAAARHRLADLPHARAERMRVPWDWPDGALDLVVVSETGYYLTAQELERLVARVEASLADDGVLVLCHWLHPIEGWFLQGVDVHDRFAAAPGLEVLVRHREPDFALDVLQRPGRPSPAAAEDLV